MRYAVISNGNEAMNIAENSYVENIITLELAQKETMEHELGKPLLRADLLGLAVGDLFNGKDWTRNADGEQRVLPLTGE